MDKEYYNKVWWYGANHPIRRWIGLRGVDFIVRKEVILSTVLEITRSRKEPIDILEVGCGLGWLTNSLSKFGNAVGIDWVVGPARKLYPHIQFIEADITSEEIPGTYDLVVSSELYEHMDDEGQINFLKKVFRLLSENGYLILTTPNRPVHETMIRDFPNLINDMQPTENWVDSTQLSSVVGNYFNIVSLKEILAYSLIKKMRRNWLLNKLITFMMLLHIPVYKKFKNAPPGGGLLLFLVAEKTSH